MENQYRKKPNRLVGYDYSAPGYYFLTICANNHECLFGRILSENEQIPAVMELNAAGQTVQAAIAEIPLHYSGVELDKFTIMPNHVHLIIFNQNGESVSQKVRSWKILISKEIGESIWQRSFYDHVIRDERDYLIRWKYIDDNPAKWASDEYFQK